MVSRLGARVGFLFDRRVLGKGLQIFIAIFGTIWLFMESLSFFFESHLVIARFEIFIFTIIFSTIIALYVSFPRLSYTRKYRKSNVEISVEVGDLLSHLKSGVSHVAVGKHNCFSTQLSRLNRKSLRSQIVADFYAGRAEALDKDILNSLPRKQVIKKSDHVYEVAINSIATVEINDKNIFFLINQRYDHIKQELHDTAKEDIWLGFCNLWTAVKSKGGNSPIAVPVLGSRIGRAPASRISLIQLILISFAIANRSVPITERLTIVIRELDYSPNEMFEISRFMDDLDL
ncbi:MAG: macro domain-containing protein [Leptolyngbyaceae cyanobacterium]